MDKTCTSDNLNLNSIHTPPGGILMWIILSLEIFTFLGVSFVFLYYRGEQPVEFTNSKSLLSPFIGTINTIILITSGYFIANSIKELEANKTEESSTQILLGLILGLAFLLIKGFEYYQKLELGVGFEYSTFFTLYWLTTGFHFIHVLFGVGLLSYMFLAVKAKKYDASNYSDVESTATYWHMCDLIWILIFPLFYLI